VHVDLGDVAVRTDQLVLTVAADHRPLGGVVHRGDVARGDDVRVADVHVAPDGDRPPVLEVRDLRRLDDVSRAAPPVDGDGRADDHEQHGERADERVLGAPTADLAVTCRQEVAGHGWDVDRRGLVVEQGGESLSHDGLLR
jgi:hypothetical protein